MLIQVVALRATDLTIARRCAIIEKTKMKGIKIAMKEFLDKLFENKKLSFWLPILLATLVYLWFLLFGTAEDKSELLIFTPVAAIFWLFGVFFLLFIQVKNPMCPEWFLDVVELLIILIFVGSFVGEVFSFIFGGFRNFNPLMCVGVVTYSSVCWAHSKRTKKDN